MSDTFERGRFAGRVAVVTGAAQGIGEATARLLAERGAAGLLLTDRNAEKGRAVAASISKSGVPAEFIAAELDDHAQVAAIIPAADKRFGRVDVLCNIAGVTDRSSPWTTTPEIWDRIFAVNVRAPFFLMQAALKVMEREKLEGAMVNITSVNAHGGSGNLTPYSASKGALVTLTKNLAGALAWSRIKVNAINVGWADTPGEHVTRTTFDGAKEDWLAEAEKSQPWGRLIKPDEVARMIAYLASDESGAMTGAVIDYGQHVPGTPRGERPARS